MTQYTHILFDLDGTLIDSSIGIHHSYLAALDAFNLTVSMETLKNKIGPPAPETLKELFPDIFSNPVNLKKALYAQRKYYRAKGVTESEIYPGVIALLSALKNNNKTLCIATSKPTVFAKKILAYQNLLPYFNSVDGSTLNLSRTKKTEIIAHVLEKYVSIPLNQIVMIGDRRHDIQGAKENHINAIGVTYGFGNTDEIKKAHPDAVVHNVAELSVLLNYALTK